MWRGGRGRCKQSGRNPLEFSYTAHASPYWLIKTCLMSIKRITIFLDFLCTVIPISLTIEGVSTFADPTRDLLVDQVTNHVTEVTDHLEGVMTQSQAPNFFKHDDWQCNWVGVAMFFTGEINGPPPPPPMSTQSPLHSARHETCSWLLWHSKPINAQPIGLKFMTCFNWSRQLILH